MGCQIRLDQPARRDMALGAHMRTTEHVVWDKQLWAELLNRVGPGWEQSYWAQRHQDRPIGPTQTLKSAQQPHREKILVRGLNNSLTRILCNILATPKNMMDTD